MQSRVRASAWVAIWVVLALLLSACAGKPPETKPAAQPGQAPAAQAPSGPQGELVIAQAADVGGSWDPIDTFLLA